MIILRTLRRSSRRIFVKAEFSTVAINNAKKLRVSSKEYSKIRQLMLGKHFENKNEASDCSYSKSLDTALAVYKSEKEEEKLEVDYYLGWPQIVVPLPSRNEKCRFILKPITNTVADFYKMVKNEDRGVDRVVCTTLENIKIARCTSIQNLLAHDFKLVINDIEYHVTSKHITDFNDEDIKNMNHLTQLISTLYESLNVREFESFKEKELFKKLEALKLQIIPLEQKKSEFDKVAAKETKAVSWLALVYMSIQTGILARLTWWEYSWDIMEPVTYFVTYGTTMAAFAYFLITKTRYSPETATDWFFLRFFYNVAKKKKFDVQQYNLLKDQIAEIEAILERLRDPVRFRTHSADEKEGKEGKAAAVQKVEKKDRNPQVRCKDSEE